jgi:hypothetical protein
MAMIDNQDDVIREQPVGDADTNGHLAMAMFIGVIVLMLVLIYALATGA